MDKYPELKAKRKTGDEPFHHDGTSLNETLLSFWQWSASDLVSNVMRGILAEYIVASALGVNKEQRTEWDNYDLETAEGIKVEVKSGAYLQRWGQKKLSSIQFRIRPAKVWDFANNQYTEEVKRHSDVYVFCILKHKDQNTIDPLNMAQWTFFVLATKVLNQSVGQQKTITLSSLLNLKPVEVPFDSLNRAIKQAFSSKK